MKKLILFICLLIATNNIFSQVYGNNQYSNQQNSNKTPNRDLPNSSKIVSNDEIVVEVNGIKNILADSYVAMFSITQVGETAEITNQLMNSRINDLITELLTIGIKSTNFSIDMISFVPKFDLIAENKIFSKTFNEVPSGFVMQKNISIEYEKSNELDKIISAAAKYEIYDLVKVDYFVTDINKQIDSLRTLCLQTLKTKIKSYEAIGFKLDTMQKVFNDNFIVVYPETRYFSYSAFSRPSLNAANKKTSKADINESEKFQSVYYNQIEYDYYDIVVNPVVLEPVVQISYSITIKYISKKQINNKYFVFPADGTVKQFNP